MKGPSLNYKVCLWALATWGIFLSVETWFRQPGSLWSQPLPPRRLTVDGVVYEREPAERQERARKNLPSATRWSDTGR